jgi:hypothetical protein
VKKAARDADAAERLFTHPDRAGRACCGALWWRPGEKLRDARHQLSADDAAQQLFAAPIRPAVARELTNSLCASGLWNDAATAHGLSLTASISNSTPLSRPFRSKRGQ